jgi:pimeloyl-ACP methyl ester carboxylesterase
MNTDTLKQAVALAREDAEFCLKSTDWTGTLVVVCDGDAATVELAAGVPAPPVPTEGPFAADPDHAVWSADSTTWDRLLAVVPEPPFTDPFGALAGGFTFEGGPFTALRHGALRRFCELLRHAEHGTDPKPQGVRSASRHGDHDASVGRYVHLDIDGVDHRVYYEEAGSGIPLLCQHTAGSDGRQWRHVLEDARITSRYRVVVYDLPFHGKSLPPEGTAWWAKPYRLTADVAKKVPTLLADVLGLARPVFIGSSIGGMLALQLARYHPDVYRAVIAVEGALKVDMGAATPPALATALGSADPAVHAELMNMLMAPQAPEAYRQETRFEYAQGAPGVFTGDLYFFAVEHDLRAETANFDTDRCKVFMLTGEYDYGTVRLSRAAAEQIPGTEFEVMKGLGHFPMAEDPDRFASYLIPVLDRIADAAV